MAKKTSFLKIKVCHWYRYMAKEVDPIAITRAKDELEAISIKFQNANREDVKALRKKVGV